MGQVVKQKVGAKPRAGTSENRAQARLPAGDPRESWVAGSVGEQVRAVQSVSSLSSSTNLSVVIGVGSSILQVGLRSPQRIDKSNHCPRRVTLPGGRYGRQVKGTSNQLRG